MARMHLIDEITDAEFDARPPIEIDWPEVDPALVLDWSNVVAGIPVSPGMTEDGEAAGMHSKD